MFCAMAQIKDKTVETDPVMESRGSGTKADEKDAPPA